MATSFKKERAVIIGHLGGLLDLTACRCLHVAMETTGAYCKPVWNILSDADFAMMVANAAHIKNVPSRETDIKDTADAGVGSSR